MFAGRQVSVDDESFTVTVEADPAGDGAAPGSRVRLDGELDLGARDVLRDTLFTIIDDEKPREIVVDLSGVTFIDSEAISGLLDGYLAAGQAGIAFRLANATGIVRRVFDVIDVPHLFGD